MRLMLKYSLDNCMRSIGRTLLIVIMGIITFILLGVLVFMYEKAMYFEKSLDNVLSNGIDGTGFIYCDDEYDYDEFIMGLSALDGIDAVGTWGYGVTDSALKELKSIQGNNTIENIEGFGGSVEIISINATLFNLCNIGLENGKYPDELDEESDDVIYIYLGSEYDVAVGTEYVDKYGDHKITYKVAGILEENCRWIDYRMADVDAITPSSTFNLDYAIIELSSGDEGSYIFFNNQDGIVDDELEQKITDVAQELGVNIVVGNVRSVIDERKISNSILYKYLIPLLVLMIIVAVTVQTCIQTVAIMMNISEYGIIYANGVSSSGLTIILLMENIFKVIVSLIPSVILAGMLIKSIYTGSEQDYQFISDIYNNYVVYKMILMGVVITAMSTFFASAALHKYEPIEMVRDVD